MTPFARTYARAFLETLPQGYDVEAFLEKAGAIRAAFDRDARLKAFFGAPAIDARVKEKVLDDLSGQVGLEDFGRRFLRLALEHRRLPRLAEILAAVREEYDRRRGVVAARVTVASPIAAGEEQAMAQRLSRVVGRAVRLHVDVDEKILAGFVARIGSEVFDASALRAIERFQQEAKESAGA